MKLASRLYQIGFIELTLRIAILQILKNRVLKEVDLAMKVIELMHPVMFSTDEFCNTLERMVAEGEIIEVEYIMPNAPNQVKSIYFPKGTVINK